MTAKTNIAWTEMSWNPVTGCSKVSPGCANCYAETLSLRHRWTEHPWTPEHAAENVVMHPERLEAPLHWRKPRRVFVNSMSDLFHERVPDSFIESVFAIMARSQQHVFQVLTKRPGRMAEWFTNERGVEIVRRCYWAADREAAKLAAVECWPLPNVWLGVSVENQHWADERVPLLLQTPAAVRFVSAEPLLGPVSMYQYVERWCTGCGQYGGLTPAGGSYARDGHVIDGSVPDVCGPVRDGIDWLIVGGESGPKRRDLELSWVTILRDQCRAAGVAYFGKQNSGPRPGIPLPGELGDQEWPHG